MSLSFFPSAPEDWFEPQPTTARLSSFEESLTLIFVHRCWSPGIAQRTAIVLCLQLKREDKVNTDEHGDKVCVSLNGDQREKDAQEDASCYLFLSKKVAIARKQYKELCLLKGKQTEGVKGDRKQENKFLLKVCTSALS